MRQMRVKTDLTRRIVLRLKMVSPLATSVRLSGLPDYCPAFVPAIPVAWRFIGRVAE
jgi:hypothetical protein